jgi:hypothetical protein
MRDHEFPWIQRGEGQLWFRIAGAFNEIDRLFRILIVKRHVPIERADIREGNPGIEVVGKAPIVNSSATLDDQFK